MADQLGSFLHRHGKVLLVCAEGCDEVKNRLEEFGCEVVEVDGGKGAVSRAMRETFDVGVLVSTGKEMDVAETVLNLRDICGWMQIVIVADRAGTKKSVVSNLVQVVPNTEALTMESLEHLLDSVENEESES